MPTENNILYDAARVLAELPRPLSKVEKIRFAHQAVHDAVMIPSALAGAKVETMSGLIMDRLKETGATLDEIEQIARAILWAADNWRSIGQAKKMVATMFLGVAIHTSWEWEV